MTPFSTLPRDIRRFELLAITGLLFGNLIGILSSQQTPGVTTDEHLIIGAISISIGLVLIICTSRFRNNVTRWIFTLWIGIAYGGVLVGLGLQLRGTFHFHFNTGDILASLIAAALNLSAISCLFTRRTRQWFDETRAPGAKPGLS